MLVDAHPGARKFARLFRLPRAVNVYSVLHNARFFLLDVAFFCNSWVSCKYMECLPGTLFVLWAYSKKVCVLAGEEEDGYGHCWQVDPANKEQTGPTKSARTNITGYRGGVSTFLLLLKC